MCILFRTKYLFFELFENNNIHDIDCFRKMNICMIYTDKHYPLQKIIRNQIVIVVDSSQRIQGQSALER